MSQPTIAAIATAVGMGAIGIVRVSGSLVSYIVRTIGTHLPQPRMASLQLFRSITGVPFDQGLVIYFKAPASYTGEDMVEFHAHGGQVVLSKLLQTVYAAGAIPARPGEFSERAFLNGKLDLLQAEAVADLIGAGTDRALKAALNALTGEFSKQISAITNRIVELRAMLEAAIDFADDVSSDHTSIHVFTELCAVRETIDSLIATAARGAVLNRGVKTVIVGRPNSGKSTLLNRILGQERAIVSASPGTTRDVLHADVNLSGLLLSLQDTAGIHDATNDIELEGIRRALAAMNTADLVLHVIDATKPCDEIPNVINTLSGVQVIKVFNKIDLINVPPSAQECNHVPEIYLSAQTGEGMDLLSQTILRITGVGEETDSAFLARERHVSALDRANRALTFESPDQLMENPEISAERLRIAHLALGEITGEFTTEDLLGTIFSRFCIGK
jgi:tRNA modification GTPase